METLICICMNIVYIILGSSAPRISIEAFRPVRARQTCKVSITVCTLDVHGPRLRRLQLKPDRHRHRHRRSTTIGVHWPRFSGFDSFNQAEFYFSFFFYFSFSFCACDRAIKWFSDRWSCSGLNAIEFCSSEDESRPFCGSCWECFNWIRAT